MLVGQETGPAGLSRRQLRPRPQPDPAARRQLPRRAPARIRGRPFRTLQGKWAEQGGARDGAVGQGARPKDFVWTSSGRVPDCNWGQAGSCVLCAVGGRGEREPLERQGSACMRWCACTCMAWQTPPLCRPTPTAVQADGHQEKGEGSGWPAEPSPDTGIPTVRRRRPRPAACGRWGAR